MSYRKEEKHYGKRRSEKYYSEEGSYYDDNYSSDSYEICEKKYHHEDNKCHKRERCEKRELRKYSTCLVPEEEVLFVLSKADGKFKAKANDCVLKYKLFVRDIDGVTAAHIHLGNPGQDGPVVAFLFGPVPPTGPVCGILAEGKITGADLVGPLQGKSLRKLLRLMDKGLAYINVHTEEYPAGELRGQVNRVCH